MNIRIYILMLSLLVSFVSCNEPQLIKDSDYLDKINSKFLERQELLSGNADHIFSVITNELSREETEAMKFLVAFMPLSDLADYSGQFFLDNIRLSLKAKKQNSWAADIPENIFLHFVLPPRVNNENLDSFRIAYYDEILARVRHFDNIAEAALEINHWCHGKVSYKPSDIRTSGPMATILSARGRCGEESTFTVAALRTAGIPARQVYTPRWAHSDDNHAWVEVWVNGKWEYLGACEPEPVLSRGWFTEPARRAMLTHTRAYGLYRGDENQVRRDDNYSVINTLPYYAVTRTIHIKVTDSQHNPVSEATVEPSLYNYAEFYPLARLETDEDGLCSFQTGLGDLLIWAYKGNTFGFEKITVEHNDTLILSLGMHNDVMPYYEFDLQAPAIPVPYKDTVDPVLKKINRERLKQEDSIRHAAVNSWMDDEEATALARSLELDTKKVKDIISRSMGNYEEIASFMKKAPAVHRKFIPGFLNVISDKDLRDTRAYVLNDHLSYALDQYSAGNYPEEIFIKYVLSPRIADELITPWRSFVHAYFDTDAIGEFKAGPQSIARWIENNISAGIVENYYNVALSPAGILSTGHTDKQSRKILFVALARSVGVPAKIEEGTGILQFYSDDKWNDLYFSDEGHEGGDDGLLNLYYTKGGPVPEYHIHFTLAAYRRGKYHTLDYSLNKKITDFDYPLSLPQGKYMLVTGNRTGDSGVLSRMEFFELKAGEEKTLEVKIRHRPNPGNALTGMDTGLLK